MTRATRRRRAVAGSAAAALAVLIGGGAAAPAVGAQTTDVVQGQVLRLVSVADWAAASSLRPGHPVQWDVTVSADAPDPGTVRIGISARGDAPLLVDAQICMQPWVRAECPGGARTLRSSWPVPRDGVEVALIEMSDADVGHLRLGIALEGAGDGSTEVRVHAQGAGESAVIGPDGGLAATGLSPHFRWAFAAGGALLVVGAALAFLRRPKDTADTPHPPDAPESSDTPESSDAPGGRS